MIKTCQIFFVKIESKLRRSDEYYRLVFPSPTFYKLKSLAVCCNNKVFRLFLLLAPFEMSQIFIKMKAVFSRRFSSKKSPTITVTSFKSAHFP